MSDLYGKHGRTTQLIWNLSMGVCMRSKTMTDYYKGDRIVELLAELEHAEKVFNSVDPEKLNEELWNKLIAAKASVAINKAKLTALQQDPN
jgi:hypothetical protein